MTDPTTTPTQPRLEWHDHRVGPGSYAKLPAGSLGITWLSPGQSFATGQTLPGESGYRITVFGRSLTKLSTDYREAQLRAEAYARVLICQSAEALGGAP